MGILRNSTWDAFSSYSSLDDELHHGWIQNFTIDLKERVRLLLEQKGHDFDLDQVAFFFDKESMPANGSLEDELIANMKTSSFLLLFVGDNYLKSPWCGKELDWFSARFSGIPKEALKNMFMIALTPTALRNASNANLQKVKSNGIFQLAYAPRSETPIEPHFPDEFGQLRTNPGYAKLVDKIAKTLADRFVEAGLVGLPPPPPPPAPTHTVMPFGAVDLPTPQQPIGNAIAFGVVSRSLKDYRSKLAASVQEKLKIDVDCWEWEDLGLDPEQLNTRLERAKVFIQLVDKSPIGILGGSQPGGFLAAQRDLVKKTPVLWVNPLDGAKPDQEEHNPDHAGFLASVLSGALRLSADDVLQEITRRLTPDEDHRSAKIMIEHSEEDQQEVLRVREIIEQAWANIAQPGLRLRFSGADWSEMKGAPDQFNACHGIVVVDRSRPWATLEAQLGDIEDELAKRNRKLAHRTFVLPPKSRATILNWEFIRFQKAEDDGHVEVITQAALDTFLAKVKERALA